MKNHLNQVLILTVLTTLLLTFVSAISEEFTLAGIPFRKVDIFQDIRKDEPEIVEPSDSVFQENLPPGNDPTHSVSTVYNAQPDTSLFGKTIEDYTEKKLGLAKFFKAIDSIKTHGNQVRIAFFGDSFVEGDILLGDLRDTLQTLFGGRGVGFVPITSEVAQYRRSFKQIFKGWKTFGIVKNHESGQPFGLNGFVYRPEPEASFRFDGLNYFKNTDRFSQFRFFYESEKEVEFVWQNLDNQPVAEKLIASPGKISQWKFESPAGINAFACRFPETKGLKIYGASLDQKSGIFMDNFSMRGLTGGKLKLISPEIAQQFDHFLNYDLVVVQLGLNAVTPKLNNIPWYEKELDDTFVHLRKCFPGKTILIFSVADRGGKVNGQLATMPAVPAIVSMQRRLAQKHGFLFWDLFRGMGGPGTMVSFANQKPALANKDYTHLTHDGGKWMGHLVADLLQRSR